MRTFIKKLFYLLLLVAFILTIFISFGKMLYESKEYPMWKFKIDYAKENGDSQNIIFGDSRAVAGFIPKEIDNDFVNLALGGGTSIESYFLLRKLLEKNIPKKIILSLAPFHMSTSDVFFKRTLAYDFLSTSELKEILNISKKLNFNFWTKELFNSPLDLYKFQIKSHLTHNNFFLDYRPSLKAFSFNPLRPIQNYYVFKEIKNNSGQYTFGNKAYSSGLNTETESENFTPNKLLDYYLKKTLSLALDNNIKIYMINTPFNQSSFENISSNYKSEYNEYIKKLKDEYVNVLWYSELMFYSNDSFGDRSHLNKKGAQIFSNYVKDIIDRNQN